MIYFNERNCLFVELIIWKDFKYLKYRKLIKIFIERNKIFLSLKLCGKGGRGSVVFQYLFYWLLIECDFFYGFCVQYYLFYLNMLYFVYKYCDKGFGMVWEGECG